MNTVDYAHNDYLQGLAEFGVFGAIAGLVFVLRLFYRSMRGALYAPSIDHRYIANRLYRVLCRNSSAQRRRL